MLDGIRLSSEQTATVTLGIDSGSRNHVLDFTQGNSENLKVSRKLVSHIVAHGCSCERRFYAVPVGSDALRAAVKEFFADAIGRRCLVHKERNITGKLSNRHCGELSRLLMQLRSIQGISAAEEVFGGLLSFLQPISEETFRSLHEAGKFTMGENDDAHKVTLTKSFMLGAYEVTQGQYERVMEVNPSHFKGATNPVEKVTWNDAIEFCRRLSELPAEKAAGNIYRLPTEAEWGFACRAGITTKYSFGDDDSDVGDYAWFRQNSSKRTHPVGGKQPNAWGLYDMHGNVWEWCSDRYEDYPDRAVTDPTGARTGSRRVLRGGGWSRTAEDCRSAYRSRRYPSYRYSDFGFRVSLSPSGK